MWKRSQDVLLLVLMPQHAKKIWVRMAPLLTLQLACGTGHLDWCQTDVRHQGRVLHTRLLPGWEQRTPCQRQYSYSWSTKYWPYQGDSLSPAIFEAVQGLLPPQRSQETTCDFFNGQPVGWQQQPTLQPTSMIQSPTHNYSNNLASQEGRVNSHEYNYVFHIMSFKVSLAPYRISQWYPIGGLIP